MRALYIRLTLLIALFLAGCSAPELPSLPSLPALPDELRQLPDLVRELGLPDLSSITDLPGLDALPSFQAPPGAIRFSGPIERRVNVGERIPGTDIMLTAGGQGEATFQIAGLNSVRRVGDSLDFDGDWVGLPGAPYNTRLRLYSIADDHVRIAGVHQLTVPNIQPMEGTPVSGTFTMRFPYTDSAEVGGGAFDGITQGYAGSTERGAQITGLPQNVYPYLKTGDSLRWIGALRPDIGAEFNLRMLNYGENSARVGGIVTLTLPGS
jgi:hypothetical protein